MKNIRIDMVVPYAGQGGVEDVVKSTAAFLKQRGYEIRVIEMVWDGKPWLDPDIPFYPLRRKKVEDIERFVDLYGVFMEQMEAPDVVLAVAWPFMTYVVRKALKIMGNSECKVISWLHAPVKIYAQNHLGGFEHLALSDRVFCLTKGEQNYIASNLGPERVTQVYNPILKPVNAKVPSTKTKNPTLLYVGRLSEEKHVDVILQAMAQTNTMWNAIIIGDGVEREHLYQLAEDLQLQQRVNWLGWQENPWDAVAKEAVDFLVLASEYEGFALVAVEALAAGIPVIGTPVGILPELVVPGETGYLFAAGDSSQLAVVLDFITAGELPIPNRENCKASVKCFEKGQAFRDLEEKILEVLKC